MGLSVDAEDFLDLLEHSEKGTICFLQAEASGPNRKEEICEELIRKGLQGFYDSQVMIIVATRPGVDLPMDELHALTEYIVDHIGFFGHVTYGFGNFNHQKMIEEVYVKVIIAYNETASSRSW
jgi:hypothetical protein